MEEELPKQRSQESSSSDEENDRQEEVKEDTPTSTAPKRSYECTFCKRGFTNAQALGGHMNIHRKDRAKNKQTPSSASSVSSKAREECMNPSYTAAISSETAKSYPVFETQRNYHMYFQQSAPSNPRLQHDYYHGSDHHHFLVPKPQSLNLNEEELWGANLSLQIGSANLENSELQSGVSKEDELDLELRLGHDPQ